MQVYEMDEENSLLDDFTKQLPIEYTSAYDSD